MNEQILIVEDDEDQREHYAAALRELGYIIAECVDRKTAIDAAKARRPDLAILDVMLGEDVGGGYEVCRYLKDQYPGMPIIFLTSRGDELDKIYGLQLGAWDYQAKPVSLEYLSERVRSLFRIRKASQAGSPVNEPVTTGDITIDRAGMSVSWKGREIMFTPTEFEILVAILDAPSGASMEALSKATRQGVVEDNTINTHILHIRKKFKAVDGDFACIKTRYGFGYAWAC